MMLTIPLVYWSSQFHLYGDYNSKPRPGYIYSSYNTSGDPLELIMLIITGSSLVGLPYHI